MGNNTLTYTFLGTPIHSVVSLDDKPMDVCFKKRKDGTNQYCPYFDSESIKVMGTTIDTKCSMYNIKIVSSRRVSRCKKENK